MANLRAGVQAVLDGINEDINSEMYHDCDEHFARVEGYALALKVLLEAIPDGAVAQPLGRLPVLKAGE